VPEVLVRVTTYISALGRKEGRLVAIAEEQLSVEDDPYVQWMVARRVPRLQRAELTREDT
jgi:hypothetical protein